MESTTSNELKNEIDIIKFNKIKETIENSNFNSSISITQIETTFQASDNEVYTINKYKVQGNISMTLLSEYQLLKEEIQSIIKQDTQNNVPRSPQEENETDTNTDLDKEISINILWDVKIGYTIDDNLPCFQLWNMKNTTEKINFNKKLNVFYIWSLHNKCFNSELSFIEMKNILTEASLIEYVNLIMISSDKNIDSFIQFINHKNWNIFMDQYINPEIFDILNISECPCLIITDSYGIINYIGSPYAINLFDTVSNNINSSRFEVVYSINISNTNNIWWKDLDDDSKRHIVKEINSSLSEISLKDVSFMVIQQTIFKNRDLSFFIVPVFSGCIRIEDEQLLKDFMNDLIETVGFINIQENIVYSNKITKESNLEILSLDSN